MQEDMERVWKRCSAVRNKTFVKDCHFKHKSDLFWVAYLALKLPLTPKIREIIDELGKCFAKVQKLEWTIARRHARMKRRIGKDCKTVRPINIRPKSAFWDDFIADFYEKQARICGKRRVPANLRCQR